jgi:hypothetical protein
MRRSSVATVLTAHGWEEDFVSFVRDTAGLRIITRAYEPQEAVRRSPDVIVVGSETSWISPTYVRTWKRNGIGVVGLHPMGDEPGRRLFEDAGADIVLPETTPSVALFRIVQAISVAEQSVESEGTLVSVTGPRGAPGRTEIALAIATSIAEQSRTLLIDLDPPSLGIRLGIGPRPTLADTFDRMRVTGALSPVRRIGPLSVLAGVEGGPLAASLRWELIQSSLGIFDFVVADLGPWPQNDRLLERSHSAILVCDTSPTGLVRAGTIAENWTGPTPLLVLNRAAPADVGIARQAMGLEPVAIIPHLDALVPKSSRSQHPPHTLVEMVRPIRGALRK